MIPLWRTASRDVLKLAWPATLQQLLIALVFVVDRLVVARCGEAELASLHVSTTVTWTLTSLISALSVASLASIGKLIGAGRRDRAGGTAWLSLGIALGLGAAAGIALWATASTIATAFSLEPAVAHQVVAYLEVMAPFIPAAFFHSAAAACLHGAGDTRTPLSAGALATLVNVLLSMALAFGWGPLPALGVRGAALGSGIAFTVEAVALGVVLTSPASPLRLRRPRKHLRRLLSELVALGLPAAGERALCHAGYLGFAALIANAGTRAIAAHQALIGIETLVFPIAEGIGIAAAALVAHALGRGDAASARRIALASALAAAALLAVAAGAIGLATGTLVAAFSPGPEVTGEMQRAILWLALSLPLMGYATVMGMALRGGGALSVTLLTTFATTLVLRLALASWLVDGGLMAGLVGGWIAIGVDWAVHALCLTVWLWRRGWSAAAEHAPVSSAAPAAV